MVQGYELRPVRERRLDLHLVDDVGHALHDVSPSQDLAPRVHELGDRSAVARALVDVRREQCDRFGVVESDTARTAIAGDHRGDRDEQTFLLVRGKAHDRGTYTALP